MLPNWRLGCEWQYPVRLRRVAAGQTVAPCCNGPCPVFMNSTAGTKSRPSGRQAVAMAAMPVFDNRRFDGASRSTRRSPTGMLGTARFANIGY